MADPAAPFAVFDAQHLPELAAWSRSWQARWATSQPTDRDEADHLRSLIEKSQLPAINRMLVGKLVMLKGDNTVAAVWFRCAMDQVEREIADARRKYPNDSNADIAELVLRPLLHNGMNLCGDLFWEIPDDGGMEERLTRLELPLVREQPWDQRPEWMRIGHAEALLNLGRVKEALAETQVMEAEAAQPDSHFVDLKAAELHWSVALIDAALHRDAEMVPKLLLVIHNSKFRHARDAHMLLINTLCRLHRGHDADAAFVEYRSLYPVDPGGVASMQGLIDDAKFNEQYDKSHPMAANQQG